MKNHIIFKFAAIALCALVLLSAVVSGAGIAVLVANNFYTEGLPDWKSERIAYGANLLLEGLAGEYIVKTQYADCPEFVLEQTDLDYSLTQPLYYSSAQDLRSGTTYYTIHDEHGNLLDGTTVGTELPIPDGLTSYSMTSSFSYQEIISMVDVTSVIDDDGTTTPATGVEETIPMEEQTDSATIPQRFDRSYSVCDSKNDTYYEVFTQKAETPILTVTLYVYEPSVVFAQELEAAWDFVELLHENRIRIIWVFGASLLLFAIFAVYLCCAAGKKPGTQEIRPAGFNALPLDLYAVGAGGIITIIVVLLYEVITWGGSFDITDVGRLTIIASGGYAVCLLFVAFCFACAAQFKMPDLFWLRRSLCGMVLIFSFRCIGRVLHFLQEKLPPFTKKGWADLVSLCKKIYHFTGRFAKKLYAITCTLCKELWKLACQVWSFIWKHTRNFLHMACHGISRFFDLLPLTWQWLLLGFMMFFLCIIAFRTYSTGSFIAIFICIGIILYGAHAFGILMEAAKRMGQGDLDTKVSDQFLLGSFKDFAGHLNALADVAVVAAQKQMKSERMKTELITNVSHDIKTPLTSIINYVDLLQLPHSEEDEAQYLEVLGRKSQQLKKLIDDLMEMSKASTGNLSVDIRQVDAAEALNQALGEFADKLALCQLTPVFSQPENPVLMKADGRLVWRVFSNLLGNAVKYALPGTRLYIDLVQAGGKVLVSMKNISREPLNVSADELMERFVRGDASRNTEGSGLGLNIAKSLMEVQHGQLQLMVDGDLFKVTLVFPGVDNQP